MTKKSEEYLSPAARRALEDPSRARAFLKSYLEAGAGEMAGTMGGCDFVLINPEDVDRISDEAAVWVAKGQAGFEQWTRAVGLVEEVTRNLPILGSGAGDDEPTIH
jgi:hypothetical protein